MSGFLILEVFVKNFNFLPKTRSPGGGHYIAAVIRHISPVISRNESMVFS